MIHLKRFNSKTNWFRAGVLLIVSLALFPYGWLVCGRVLPVAATPKQ